MEHIRFSSHGQSFESIPFNSLFDSSEAQPTKPSVPERDITYKPPTILHTVLKISNISWDTTSEDISTALKIPLHQIHIPIDRFTGKTLGDIYVQLPDVYSLLDAIELHDRRLLRGRSLSMTASSLYELHSVFFPGGKHLGEEDACSLINICKHYKVHFDLS